MDHNNCIHCSLLGPQSLTKIDHFGDPTGSSISKQPPWVHSSYPENLSLPNSDRPTPDPIITGGRFWWVIFDRNRPEIWGLETSRQLRKGTTTYDVEKCMWSWHYCHFVGSATAKKPQFRWCCSIPKMDSKDGLHPKLIHTLGGFPCQSFGIANHGES